jgi:hypothetical protein
MSSNVLLQDSTRHTRTLPLLIHKHVRGLGSFSPLLTQLLGLRFARWVSVHEVVVRMRLGKRVTLGRL